MPRVVHYACDVGSTRLGRFGWAAVEPAAPHQSVRASSNFDALVKSLSVDLADETASVTLGIESPLFLPVPDDVAGLGAGRRGDKDRSCFAPPGGYVATLGLHQFAFILRRVRRQGIMATLDWARWTPRHSEVLVWEAFVSGRAHSQADEAATHQRDAATAAMFFEEALEAAKRCGNPVRVPEGTTPLSLAGLALVWAGWSQDLNLLSQDALVVKPERPYPGPVAAVP